MTDLVKFSAGGVPANPSDLAKGLSNVGRNIPDSGGMPFLRLLRTGNFAYGQENIEPEADSLWAVNPYSIQHGFACWGDGELLDEIMVPFNQAPPPRGELPDLGEPWDPQVSVVMQCLNGEDKGQAVLYKGTSVGLRNAVKALINDIITQAGHDPDHIVPVVSLDVDSYQHKKYGEIFTPELTIEKWVSIESGAAAEPEQTEEKAEAADTADAESAAAGDPEPAEKSTRRRRRRSK